MELGREYFNEAPASPPEGVGSVLVESAGLGSDELPATVAAWGSMPPVGHIRGGPPCLLVLPSDGEVIVEDKEECTAGPPLSTTGE